MMTKQRLSMPHRSLHTRHSYPLRLNLNSPSPARLHRRRRHHRAACFSRVELERDRRTSGHGLLRVVVEPIMSPRVFRFSRSLTLTGIHANSNRLNSHTSLHSNNDHQFNSASFLFSSRPILLKTARRPLTLFTSPPAQITTSQAKKHARIIQFVIDTRGNP